MNRLVTRLLAAISVCTVPSVAAKSESTPSADDWAKAQLAPWLRPDMTWTEFQQAMRTRFLAIDRNGNGIDPDDYTRIRREREAQQRAQLIGRHLSRDLDNDGVVTREELIAVLQPRAIEPLRSAGGPVEPTPDQRKAILDKLVADALKDDRNKDGAITFDEMREAAAAESVKQFGSDLGLPRVPMSLDTNGDGVISSKEWDDALRRAFRVADTNDDGKLAPDEVTGAQEAVRAAQQAVQRADMEQRQRIQAEARARVCQFPVLPREAKLVLVGAYEGEALSTVSLGGDDREVTVSQLEIEPGSDPIYLVLTSYDANVWLISGAVERVAQVVATSRQDGADKRPRVGVVGVKPDRVRFAAQADCLPYFSRQPTRESAEAVATTTMFLDRAPDAVVAAYGIATMAVPSGRLDKQAVLPGSVVLPKSGPAREVWAEMLRFNPAGLITIAPEAVVSPLQVKRYEVLPQEAGLAQLVEEGALKIAGRNKVIDLNGSQPEFGTMPGAFLIQRKIRFPAGLNGAHSVRFILGRGVPRPEGQPGHSCVTTEGEGGAASGPGC